MIYTFQKCIWSNRNNKRTWKKFMLKRLIGHVPQVATCVYTFQKFGVKEKINGWERNLCKQIYTFQMSICGRFISLLYDPSSLKYFQILGMWFMIQIYNGDRRHLMEIKTRFIWIHRWRLLKWVSPLLTSWRIFCQGSLF